MSTQESRSKFRVGIGWLGLAGLILLVTPVSGAVFNWTNDISGTASWNTPGNWLEGVSPASGGAADTEICLYSNIITALPNGVAIVAANNLGAGAPSSFALNILTLNGLAPASFNGTVTLTGADLVFTNNAGTLPVVNLNGMTNTATLTYQISSNVRLVDNTTFQGTGLVAFVFSGVISGGGNLIKTNTSILTLTGANTYTGATILQKGLNANSPSVLEAGDGVGLPTASNLQLAGGVLQITSPTPVTFARVLGTGGGQVQWIAGMNGGFSANGAKLTLNIGGNATPDTLIWGSTANFIGSGNELELCSPSATAEIEVRNNIDLAAGSSKLIRVVNNPSSDGDFVTMSGIISNGTLDKRGSGTLKLTGANTIATLVITESAAQAAEGVGLPSSAILKLNGGVLQSSGTFSRSLGASGAGKIQLNSGGFSAAGGKLTVTMAGAPNPLVWASTVNFLTVGNPLVFGSVTSDSEVEFTHNINLNDAQRIIPVTDNPFSSADFATISGVISCTTPSLGEIVKQGAGTLKLTATNTFTGPVSVQQGVLEAMDGVGLPAASNLRLNWNSNIPGVFQSTGTFTRVLGTGAGQVQWIANRHAGFAAAASKLTVNLGGNPTPSSFVWGSTVNFISMGYALVFGSTTSGAEIEFQHPIDLNGSQKIQVDDNPTTSADFTTLSGVLSGAGGALTKTGVGTLVLSTSNTYASITAVNAGTLLVNGSLTSGGGTVTVNNGGTLGGTGTISRVVNVVSNGTLMAGSSGAVGTLTVGANVTLAEGAVVNCDIVGGSADLVQVNGKLTLPTNATVRLNYSGSLPASMTLFSATSLAGATNSSVLSGWTLVPSSSRTFNIQGNSVVLSPRRGSVISLQ